MNDNPIISIKKWVLENNIVPVIIKGPWIETPTLKIFVGEIDVTIPEECSS